jgi:predicted enzyme related to lactoylglutathione lyase
MGQRTQYDAGTFCWVDLNTPDVPAAIDFYTKVLGWSSGGHAGEGYTILQNDGADVAGVMELSEAMRERGFGSTWWTYVSVSDVDASAARVGELGGRLSAPPFDVGPSGRMAIAFDPAGAGFVLWQPGEFHGAAVVNEVGAWVWNDLRTTDVDGAIEFYTSLFGWEIREVPGSGGQYYGIASGGRRIGGVMPAPGGGPPAWMTYFGVGSIGGALEDAEAAGGQRLVGPIDVPAGRFAVVADPLGAAYGVIEGEFDD